MTKPPRSAPWRSARLLPSVLLAVAVAVAIGAGCGSLGVQPRHLDDGTLLLECDGALSDCVRQAEDYCVDARVEVLEGRLRDGPSGNGGVMSTSTIAEVHFVCGKSPLRLERPLWRKKAPPPAASAPGPVAPVSSAPGPVAPTPAASAAEPATACVPGVTQACAGPGACRGGQACLPDGSGFGPCDCAGSSAAGAAAPR